MFLGGAALAAVAVGGWIGSSHLLCPPRRALEDYHREMLAHPADFGLHIQSWTAPGDTPALVVTPSLRPGPARKSRELRQRLTDAPAWGEIAGTVVLLHGHRGRKEDHLPICERFCAAGFRCILIDLPGHGDHPAPFATFGHREVALLGAIRDALDADHPFLLFGVSQGGAIALQTAAARPERWQGVVSVAAFASLDGPVATSARRLHPALRPFAPLLAGSASLAIWCRAGFLPSSIRPVDAAASIDMPLLLVHGDQDHFIPIRDARRLLEASPSSAKRLLVVAGAGHGRVLAADAANTYATCCRFLLDATR